MGFICELYRVDDALIDQVLSNPHWGYNYVCDQYAWVSAPLHKPGDTVFVMDKAWAVAQLLFSKFLSTRGVSFDILGEKSNPFYSGSDDLYVVRSPKVREVNGLIALAEVDEIAALYDSNEVAGLYQDDLLDNDDYLASHILNIKEAYHAAALHQQGIISRIG